jgi:8-oxo-dGTP pyrophosphatase MutT (NUDIX family)
MEKETHPIQLEVLKKLVLSESLRFSEMRPSGISSVHFTFHIKQLLGGGLVEKTGSGAYRLTIAGKEAAGRLDIDTPTVRVEKQGKIGALIIPTRVRNGVREYAIQKRLKHPYFGFSGFVSGKVRRGETIAEAAARELEEEMGLTGTLELRAIHHECTYSLAEELLEDKYFFIHVIEEPEGDLLPSFDAGSNEWLPESEAFKGDVFYDIHDLLKLAHHGPFFSERSYTVEGY